MTDTAAFDPIPTLARELSIATTKVAAAVQLLTDGCTVPFIARYRKEATGGLDEVQIRSIQERHAYLAELEARRAAILASIREQGALTGELETAIARAETKAELEDLYLPYKPKRRTRAKIARERGLEPLALRILAQPASGDPGAEAAAFVDAERGVPDVDAALQGARDIVAEIVADRADVRALCRRELSERGDVVSQRAKGVGDERTKFEQYYDYREPVAKIPSHRYLAIRRGETEEVLKVAIEIDPSRLVGPVQAALALAARSPFAGQLGQAIVDALERLVVPSVETELRVELKQRADRSAIDVFGDNLRNLLLAAPLGGKPVIGIDPGLRTGCKCAAVDATGTFVATTTFYLAGRDTAKAAEQLLAFVRKHTPSAIAVGNGTGGRETETFVRDSLRGAGLADIVVVAVNESGASVYSASDVAREEFPDLDITIRGAISIARRLQDPLAELVKIEPKAIGVGQYQHDVSQPLLAQKLGEVIESCVNHVGVLINTASASLLAYVAGIGASLARKIVAHRDKVGPFKSRKQLLDVSGLGPRAFEQAAGFLRIRGADNPLDGSAVHPERYKLVQTIARDLGVAVGDLVGDAAAAGRIDVQRYVGDGVGEPTLRDIVGELAKPGRDPRQSFEPPKFRDDVREMEDLTQGMVLEGVVTNVTAFGAFVDVGVHQDGLVHISQLADRFVKDPSEVVRVGDRIKVRVLEIDLARRRIALSARSDAAPGPKPPPTPRSDTAPPSDRPRGPGKRDNRPRPKPAAAPPAEFKNNPFAKLKDRT